MPVWDRSVTRGCHSKGLGGEVQSSGHLGWSTMRGTRANLSPGVAQQQQREFPLWMGASSKEFSAVFNAHFVGQSK